MKEKTTQIGISVFLYIIALILICIIVYNMYFSEVMVNYGLTEAFKAPDSKSPIIYSVAYKYLQLFFPVFGNVQPCAVLSAAIPLLVADLIAASYFLSKHFTQKKQRSISLGE